MTTAQKIAIIEKNKQTDLEKVMTNYKSKKQDHIDRVNCNNKGYYVVPYIPTYQLPDGTIKWQEGRPARMMLQLVSPTNSRWSTEPAFEQNQLAYRIADLYRRIWPTIVNL